MKINFTVIPVRKSLASEVYEMVDMKTAFADLIYRHGQGIQCHALALKIYNSDSETDYDDGEVTLIRQIAEQLCTPAVSDGIKKVIESANRQQQQEEKK